MCSSLKQILDEDTRKMQELNTQKSVDAEDEFDEMYEKQAEEEL